MKHLREIVPEDKELPYPLERIICGYEKLDTKGINRTGFQGHLDFTTPDRNHFYVYSIETNPSFRRMGIAREMYIRFLNMAFSRIDAPEIIVTMYVNSANTEMVNAAKKWKHKPLGTDMYTIYQLNLKREDFKAYKERIRK